MHNMTNQWQSDIMVQYFMLPPQRERLVDLNSGPFCVEFVMFPRRHISSIITAVAHEVNSLYFFFLFFFFKS